MKNKSFAIVSIWQCAVLSLLGGVVAMAIAICFNHIFPHICPLTADVFDEWQYMLRPENEVFYYRIFFIGALLNFILLYRILRNQLKPFVSLSLPQPTLHLSWQDTLIIAGFTLLILPSSIHEVLTRFDDQYYHIDGFFMAPAWASVNGLILNHDVCSNYSMLMPLILGKTLNSIGHFNYRGFITLEILLSIAYFASFYAFAFFWLNNRLLAFLALSFAVLSQLFHSGVHPIIWQFPTATTLRFWWDMIFFILLFQHAKIKQIQWLYLSAFLCGIALAWEIDTGMYLFLTLLAYIIGQSFHARRFTWSSSCAILLTVATYFFSLFCVAGSIIFHPSFWKNTFEHSTLFLNGWGALPMMDSWNSGHYIAFILGFIPPLIYTAILLVNGLKCWKQCAHAKDILAAALSVYGLGLYHYYVFRSGPTSYLVVCLPFILIMAYLVNKINSSQRKLCIALSYCLLTACCFINPQLIDYPSVIKPVKKTSPLPLWQDTKTRSQDIDLIRSWSNPKEKVVLFSSFETEFLFEAKRKPFFYYFPLFQSDDMNMLQFRSSYIYTKTRLQRVINELENAKPEYVFVEKKYFRGEIPGGYYQHFQTLFLLMAYLHQHYNEVGIGKYLLVLKRT